MLPNQFSTQNKNAIFTPEIQQFIKKISNFQCLRLKLSPLQYFEDAKLQYPSQGSSESSPEHILHPLKSSRLST